MINPEDTVQYDFRENCTEEEAVAKLLGWMRGNRRLPNLRISADGAIDVSQLPHMWRLPCPLDQFIYEEREPASARFHKAVVEGDFIEAQKWEERVFFWDEIAEKVGRYKLVLQAELARSNSKLKLAPVLSAETGSRYITLVSLDAWAKTSFGFGVLDDGDFTGSVSFRKALGGPRTKQRQQEAAILEKLRELGFDPLHLPMWRNDSPGVKAAVRDALKLPNALLSENSFEKSWERLSNSKQIAYCNPPNN